MVAVNSEEHWDLIIEPKRKLLDLPIREVIRYRDLIVLFIKRDFTDTSFISYRRVSEFRLYFLNVDILYKDTAFLQNLL